MSLPPGMETVTVTATRLRPDGTAPKGSITFTPSPRVLISAGDDVLVGGPVRMTFSGDGAEESVELLATDAAGVLPTGWTYTVEERWGDAPSRAYSISLPAADPSVDLADIAPTSPAAGELPSASAFGQSVVSAADAAAVRDLIGLGSADLVFRRADIYHDPSDKSDGSITAGTVLDSGQTVVNNVGTTPVRYSGGRIVHDPGTINVASAGYLQVQCSSGDVRRMSAQTSWAASALGAAAFVIPSSMWNQSGGLLPVAGFHTTMYGNGVWVAGVWNPAPGQSGHVEAHMLNVNSGTALTLSVTTTTPASTQATASLPVATMTADTLQAALEGLSNVGAGKVTVVGPFSGKYGIVWAASLGVTTASITASSGTPAPTVTKYGTGVTTYASYTTNGRYATSWDGTLKDLDAWIDPDTATAILYFPDGTNSGLITDPGINLWCADYAVFELFENNTGTVDVPAEYGALAVDNFAAVDDTAVLTKPGVSAELRSLAPLTLYEATNTGAVDVTSSGTIPAGCVGIEVVVMGGSGGGGSGACVNAGTAGNGGSGGGSTGVWREYVPASAFAGSTTWSVTVGHKGAGGASVSSAGSGNAGGVGTQSQAAVGPVVLRAFAGGAGAGGTTGASAGAGGGAGGPFSTGGAAAGINGAVGNPGTGITTSPGVPGSGAGGGITTGGVANNGGAGGSNLLRGFTGGTAGVVGGAAPGVGIDATGAVIASAIAASPGPGVGGGAASVTGAAQAGATPVAYGPGGAGGGASVAPNASGAGGDGVGGYVLLRAHFI